MKHLNFFAYEFTCIASMALCGCESYEPAPGNEYLDRKWKLTSTINLTKGEMEVMEASNKFNFNLMREASKSSDDGSFCISPISVSICLGMVANAAGETDRQQLLDILGFDHLSDLNSINEKLMHYLPCEKNGVSMMINNRFWVAERVQVPSEFAGTMGKVFNAGVESVDFSKQSTIEGINQWAYNSTKGLIPTILDDDWQSYSALDLTCANAIFFQGIWAKEFDPAQTKPGKFHGVNGDSEVMMMHNTINTHYCSCNGIEYLRLSLSGSNDLYVVMPPKDMPMSEFASTFCSADLDEMRTRSRLYEVAVSMPKFNTFSKTGLDEILRRLGLESLDGFDLSAIGILHPVKLSVKHKTSTCFEEKGVKFAATTTVTGDLSAVGPADTISFNIDRPFLYMIKNYDSGSMLMAGAVTSL